MQIDREIIQRDHPLVSNLCPPMDPSLAPPSALALILSSSLRGPFARCISVHGAQSVHRVHPDQGGERQRDKRKTEREREIERSGAAFDLTAKADRQKAFFCGLRESFKPTSKT